MPRFKGKNFRDRSKWLDADISGEEKGAIKGKIKFKGSIPEKESVGHSSDTIMAQSFRDLQFRGVIEVAETPNETVLRGDYPYAVIAKTNRVIDSGYCGVNNLSGNTTVRMLNSDKTQLLNVFDIATINMRVNYLYAAFSVNDDNLAVNTEINKVLAEALAKGYSSMLTQLPFYTDGVYSDMPDVENYDKSTHTCGPLTTVGSSVAHKGAWLIHYQAVLQNLVSPLSKYISTMSLEQAIMNMSFRREAPIITSLYGMLKKKAFIATLNALGTTIIADYFDKDWYYQINTMANLSSRKSNGMVDPLLTMTCTHKIPVLKLYAASGSGYAQTAYYDSTSLTSTGIFVNPDDFSLSGTSEAPVTLSLEELIYRLCRMMDPSTILTWARQLNNGSLPESAKIRTPSAYYEQINKLISSIQILAARFTSSMTEVRTFLDRMQTTGLTYWEKGMWINVDKVAQVDPCYNLILSHVFRIHLGGVPNITWDESTQRWRLHTLWNKYEGIPAFDNISGGAFLTCSLRNMSQPEGYERVDSLYLIPKLFNATPIASGYNSCLMTSRGGVRLAINVKDSATALSDASLARLDLLSEGFYVRIPYVIVPSSVEEGNRVKLYSSILAFLTNVVGYGQVYYNTAASGNFKCSAVDPDYICFVDKEIEDVSNQMITFARNYSPFRVSTPNGQRQIGFGAGNIRK